MPDKRGRPLKGEPGYETSTRAKNIAKNNAKNKAKRLKKGEPGYETSAYFKKNAKNNAKKQERARKEATERISMLTPCQNFSAIVSKPK
jgi:hypothetical protein